MTDFDKVYKYYDRFMNMFKLFKLDEVKAAADLNKNDVVVDIGGGTGRLAEYICNCCNAVYILDESEKMLSKAGNIENVIKVKGNALAAPFENDSIDTVILCDVFHHIKEQRLLLIEISRILKKGGKIVLLDFHKKHIKTRLLIGFEFILFQKLFFRTKDEIKLLLGECFNIRKFYDKHYYCIFVGEKK